MSGPASRWPGSLHARLLLAVLGTIVALQALSLLSLGAWRGWQARVLANGLIVEELRHERARLLALPATARAAALLGRERAAYGWRLVASGEPAVPVHDSDLDDLVRAAAQAGLPRPVATQRDGRPALRVALDGGQDLMIVFRDELPTTRPSGAELLAWLAAVALLVGMAAWRLVSQLTRPLRDAAAAARAMTADLDREPLPEQGPEEVRTLTRTLNALQHEVRRQLRARASLLAAVTHDLKAPLTRMKLRSSALEDAELRRRLEHDLDLMDALVEQGLAYARSERLQETRVAVDLDALLDNLAEQARDLGQDCRYAGPGVVTLVAAPRALQRLLQNLVDNALRYAGSAEIELDERADGVEIRVLDRGPGVAGGDLERMFEPFVRGAAARGDDGGSGLGLAIARNLARAHGGELALEPRDGGGLVARVRLPRA
ncbi:ATP-binding protein [Rubrivivax gelatinosus]|uniref:histidine kinase n=1 Tax=Rubrivivax gelatinosus TaxID=28068 RepID=A0ABS1DWI8_RUBGE|nr:hypothetical protein [Rubrivivax gelatinosus]